MNKNYKIIDLSHELFPDMPSYPGLPLFKIEKLIKMSCEEAPKSADTKDPAEAPQSLQDFLPNQSLIRLPVFLNVYQ